MNRTYLAGPGRVSLPRGYRPTQIMSGRGRSARGGQVARGLVRSNGH